MKQNGLIIAGITLITLFFSAGAQSTKETENCLAFSKISWNDITVSWNKTCFNNAASYRVEIIVPEVADCNKDNVLCGEEELCQTSLQPLSCDSSASPCTDVTVNITDASGDVEQSVSTKFAPYLKSTDWKLVNLSKDANGMLNARWGPPEDSSYISCATRAVAVATCNSTEVDRQPWVTEEVLGVQGNTSLDVTDCTGEITLTVSYASEVSYMDDEDVLTETKTSKTFSDLSITKISTDEIDISWTKSSFSNEDTYKIEVNNGACIMDNVSPCTNNDSCTTMITPSDIGCSSLGPCDDVTITVTGINVDRDPEIISTILAPNIPENWHFISTIEGTKLTVTWGPFSGDDARCATDTLVTATCGSTEISEKNVNSNPDVLSSQILFLDDCGDVDVTLVTVIYLSGITPIETKGTWEPETPGGTGLEGWEIALIVIGVVAFVVIVVIVVIVATKKDKKKRKTSSEDNSY